MLKFKEHLEDNLKTAEHAYDDAFNRHIEANERLKKLTEEVNRHKWDMDCAEKDIVYYQELLNDLNEK